MGTVETPHSAEALLCGPYSPALFTRLAVDGLPEQVGVAVVPGVLLDHVHEHPPQRHFTPAAPGRERSAQPGRCFRLELPGDDAAGRLDPLRPQAAKGVP